MVEWLKLGALSFLLSMLPTAVTFCLWFCSLIELACNRLLTHAPYPQIRPDFACALTPCRRHQGAAVGTFAIWKIIENIIKICE
jgi:hypothetical protein